MWELFVILLSLGLLMYTAYRGFSVVFNGTAMCLISGDADQSSQCFTILFGRIYAQNG